MKRGQLVRNMGERCNFQNVPSETYAIAILHDQNMNGQFDASWPCVPKEGYDFSNDANGPLGAPSFSATSFPYDGHNKWRPSSASGSWPVAWQPTIASSQPWPNRSQRSRNASTAGGYTILCCAGYAALFKTRYLMSALYQYGWDFLHFFGPANWAGLRCTNFQFLVPTS